MMAFKAEKFPTQQWLFGNIDYFVFLLNLEFFIFYLPPNIERPEQAELNSAKTVRHSLFVNETFNMWSQLQKLQMLNDLQANEEHLGIKRRAATNWTLGQNLQRKINLTNVRPLNVKIIMFELTVTLANLENQSMTKLERLTAAKCH